MKFLREKKGAAEQAIAACICDALFGGTRVLWLVSGGSNVQSEVAVMDLLRKHCNDKLESLAILPMDERYGAPGHADSNARALRDAGFDPGNATWIDVLMHNLPFDQTVEFYADVASAALSNAGAVVGQFGLGNDAHVAGILPHSPVAEVIDEGTVAGYEWKDFTRMTLTPKALTHVHVGYVLAYGEQKAEALERFQKHTEELIDVPAVLLYEIPDVYVYNDHIESKG